MDTILISLIASLVIATFCCIKMQEFFSHDAYIIGFLLSSFAAFILGVICLTGTTKTVDFPVEYKVFPTDTEIICYVGSKKYISDKKQAFDVWTQNKPGFIRKEYNHFGVEISDNFITK